MVPFGSAMMGTVIRRASTTETTAGGGTRPAATCGEQPEIATDAQATPRVSHPTVLEPVQPWSRHDLAPPRVDRHKLRRTSAEHGSHSYRTDRRPAAPAEGTGSGKTSV